MSAWGMSAWGLSAGAAKAPAEKTPLAANAGPSKYEGNPVWMMSSSLPYSGHPPERGL
jgi:hypothetical protein